MPDCLQISRAERRIMVSEHFFLFFVVQEVLLHVSNPYFCADVLCTSLKQSPQASSFSKSLLSGRLTLCTAFHPASPGFCKVWRASLVFLGATTERFSFPRVSAERSSRFLGAPHSPTLQIRIYLQINHGVLLARKGFNTSICPNSISCTDVKEHPALHPTEPAEPCLCKWLRLTLCSWVLLLAVPLMPTQLVLHTTTS